MLLTVIEREHPRLKKLRTNPSAVKKLLLSSIGDLLFEFFREERVCNGLRRGKQSRPKIRFYGYSFKRSCDTPRKHWASAQRI